MSKDLGVQLKQNMWYSDTYEVTRCICICAYPSVLSFVPTILFLLAVLFYQPNKGVCASLMVYF
jgi:hypothetical protein